MFLLPEVLPETKKGKNNVLALIPTLLSLILQKGLLLEEYKEANWQECLLNQVCRQQQQLLMRGEHRCLGTDLRVNREVISTG